MMQLLIPIHVTGLFLYPLKTSENQRFCFQGVQKRNVKWINQFVATVSYIYVEVFQESNWEKCYLIQMNFFFRFIQHHFH